MTPISVFWILSAAVGVFVASAFVANVYFYRRFGYPAKPEFLKAIQLRDDLDVIWEKAQAALEDGFQVKERTSNVLVLERECSDPRCIMTIRLQPGWRKLTVQCPDHPWLSWVEGGGWKPFIRKSPSGRKSPASKP